MPREPGMGDGRLNGTAGSVEAGPPPVHDCTWVGDGAGRGWADGIWPLLSLSREDSRLLWGLQVCKLWTFTAHMFEGKAVECTARSLLLSIMHCLTQ